MPDDDETKRKEKLDRALEELLLLNPEDRAALLAKKHPEPEMPYRLPPFAASRDVPKN